MGDFYLWTPVANALEVYRRRILSEPGAVYEHIWRLIHVHEALVVTLGAALASRLLPEWRNSAEPEEVSKLNELRSRITGIQSEGTAQSEPCLSGSIEAWLQLLERFGRPDVLDRCPFCKGLATYLCEGPQGPLSFLKTWKRIAPVPSGAERDGLSRITRVLGELHKGLRNEILGTLSPKYDQTKDNPSGDFAEKSIHEPLRGQVLFRGFVCTGSFLRSEKGGTNESVQDVMLRSELTGEAELWVADPFFSVDEECKVSLLFRIKSDIDPASDFFSAEYHRFAAEFEPVSGREVERDIMAPWLEISPIEVPKSQGGVGSEEQACGVQQASPSDQAVIPPIESQDPDVLRSIAEEALQRRDYEKAVAAFERLALTRDRYRYNHVAKLHYGKSLWRQGYANNEAPKEDRVRAIEKAVEVLREASDHVDPRYSAEAWYEASKAYHKLWRLTGDGHLDEACRAAEEAARLDYQTAYITWIEHLDDEKRRSV
jgi:tetratricopeptide (TPR) repeat protein